MKKQAGKAAGAVWSAIKTVAAGITEGLADRVIPQGASELGRALFTEGTGYEPYGPNRSEEPEHLQGLMERSQVTEQDHSRGRGE